MKLQGALWLYSWWICAFLLASCTTPQSGRHIQFYAFDEPQQAWPTQPYGLMHLVEGFPVYALHQLPPAPYEVKGFIHVSAEPGLVIAALEPTVVQRARKEGGEAALLTKDASTATRTAIAQKDYLVIQFKTNGLAAVIDRINIYMSLHPEEAHSPSDDLGLDRERLQALKEMILRHVPTR